MVNHVFCAITDMAKAFDTSMLTPWTCRCLNINSLNLLGLSLPPTLNLYIPSFFFVCELFFKDIDTRIEFYLSLLMFFIHLLEIVNFRNVILYL